MATSLTLQNDASLAQGYVKVNGTTSATFTETGITGNLVGNVTGNVTGSLTQGGSLTLATAQTAPFTAPNTYADFTGIPSWVRRITVMLSGASSNGNADFLLQLGNSGGIENTGYVSTSITTDNVGSSTGSNSTSGFIWLTEGVLLTSGMFVISNVSGNIWTSFHQGVIAPTNIVGGGGTKTLSSTLTQLRITTVNGTDTFDAGTINIMFEG